MLHIAGNIFGWCFSYSRSRKYAIIRIIENLSFISDPGLRKNNFNLRHLRAFREVAKYNSISAAAGYVHLSQPAITQAIAKLELAVNARLFDRQGNGMFTTTPGELFLGRVIRALDQIREGADLATKAAAAKNSKGFGNFDQLVTSSQLNSLLAIAAAGNFSLAARLMALSQPSLHRTARDLERLSGLILYKKTGHGIELTRAALLLAKNARLAFNELDQGLEEIENWRGREVGRIVIGTMPLARTFVLPHAINALMKVKPNIDVNVIDGPYSDLLHGLRHGEIDLLVGALREPVPIDDVIQQALFTDTLAIVARKNHPLLADKKLSLARLVDYPWIVPREGTPTRNYYNEVFLKSGQHEPSNVIEASSLVLIRGLLLGSDRLTIISSHQIKLEIELGLLHRLDFDMGTTTREIGTTVRKNWHPTKNQLTFLDLLQKAGNLVHQ